MDYSAAAQNIKSANKPFETMIRDIKNLSFDGIWSGSAHDTLTNNLKTSISNANAQKDAVNSFASAIEKLQAYKNNKESIEAMREQYNSLDPEKNKSQRRTIASNITNFENTNISIKSSIQSILDSITRISSQFQLVNYVPEENYKDYIVDLDKLVNLFDSGSLSKLSDSNPSNDSLYDYYSKEQVEQKISDIKSHYTGRDAAVNCALGVIEMAAKVGKKLDYDFGGGHVEGVTGIDHVAYGTDCSSFVSWAINQGTSYPFNSMSASGLISQGKKTNYENAQKGDILVSSEHVVMIVANDPSKQEFLVAEAGNSDDGVIVKSRSYASLCGAYQARDLSSVYNS